MSERENEALDAQAIDPPDNQGGGGTAQAFGMDSPSNDPQAIDPPDNNGGTGGAAQ